MSSKAKSQWRKPNPRVSLRAFQGCYKGDVIAALAPANCKTCG